MLIESLFKITLLSTMSSSLIADENIGWRIIPHLEALFDDRFSREYDFGTLKRSTTMKSKFDVSFRKFFSAMLQYSLSRGTLATEIAGDLQKSKTLNGLGTWRINQVIVY